MENYNHLCRILECKPLQEEDRELLANSLYYYCSGSDPTPIMAFGTEYPLYVYADIFCFGGDYETETGKLFQRVCDAGYVLLESRGVGGFGIFKDMKNAVLTVWSPRKDGSLEEEQPDKFFYLLFVQGEAYEVYRKMYHDIDEGGQSETILPKCLCNILYETDSRFNYSFFNKLSKRTEYILGYCYSKKYKCVAKYDYWDGSMAVNLFHRVFWYVGW